VVKGSTIAVGNPTHVHVDDLKCMHHQSYQLHYADTHNLAIVLTQLDSPPHTTYLHGTSTGTGIDLILQKAH